MERTGVIAFLLGFLLFMADAFSDVVRTRDGQTFSGQPLGEAHGVFRLRTAYGELAIPRAEIARHERSRYRVELLDGGHVEGEIRTETEEGLVLRIGEDERTIPRGQIKSVSLTKPAGAPAKANSAKKRLALHREALDAMRKKDYVKAIEKYTEILKTMPKDTLALYNVACAYALSGQKEKALASLHQSVQAGFVSFGHMSRDPDLDSLRTEPAYKELLARKEQYVQAARERAVHQITNHLARQGIDAQRYAPVYDADRQLVYFHAKPEEEFNRVREGLEAFATALGKALFDHRPEEPLYIILLTHQDSPKVLRTGIGGIFIRGANTLFCGDIPAYKLLRTSLVIHEFTHALHWADQLARQQEHPIWLVEGLATLFESSRHADGALIPLHSYRLSVVQEAIREGRIIPWDTFVKWEKKQFHANTRIAYAQARYMLFYLYEKGLLKAFYDEYTHPDHYGRDKTALESFEVVFGKSAALVERDWREWALNQTPPAIPYLGVRTEEKGSQLFIRAVMENSPAAHAGLKPGDVILAMDGTRIHSQSDLLEAIGRHDVGEDVELRVDREGKPVDVTATLIQRPSFFDRQAAHTPYLGFSVRAVQDEIQVHDVDSDSPAAQAGIQSGWRLMKIGTRDIRSVRDFLDVLRKMKPGQAVALTLQKPGEKVRTLTLHASAMPRSHPASFPR